MTYTTNNLVVDAYYGSGVVSREFETVSGGQLSDGIVWLNEIIAEKAVELDMVPYESVYSFNASTGVEKYYIPGLSQVNTIVFFKEDVRYSMLFTDRNQYFGSARVDDITALPFRWYFERSFGGGNLYIYFSPDQNYPIEIHGIFRLEPVARGQDLTTNNTVANLGVVTVTGTGEIGTEQLVVNNVDLAGTYATPTALVNYINTGVITGVTASLSGNEFILTSAINPQPLSIVITTLGTEDLVNNVNFSNFSLTNGFNTQSYRPRGIDTFYITYLKYLLMDKICTEYNFDVPPNVAKQLGKYEAMISNSSRPMDLRMEKVSTLNDGQVLSWAFVNLSGGYTTTN